MAIKPSDNETFYREVDEELRRDQMQNFWKRYGIAVIVGVVLLLAAIAGFLWWQHQRDLAAGERAEQLVQAMEEIEQGRGKEAAVKLDALVESGTPGYRAAALLTRADAAVRAGDDAAALAAFQAIADDGKIAQPYRELALIRRTALEYDTLQPAEVIRRLGPLAAAGNPWFGSAGELVAIAHLKQNQPKQAAPIFAAIARDETLPQSLRSRAVQMAGSLGIDATADTPAAATKEGSQ